MPIKKSAKKALRQSFRKREDNKRHKNAVKNAVKKLKKAVKEKNKEEAAKALPFVYKEFDKAAKVGAIKKNTASRKKSRITKMINSSFTK